MYYKTLIRPVVLYGHKTWTMLQEDERAHGVFERKVLRTIYGGVRTANGEWRSRMNHELHALVEEGEDQEHSAHGGEIRYGQISGKSATSKIGD